jgi:hypothetical protein
MRESCSASYNKSARQAPITFLHALGGAWAACSRTTAAKPRHGRPGTPQHRTRYLSELESAELDTDSDFTDLTPLSPEDDLRPPIQEPSSGRTSNIIIPSENYVGTIIGSFYRLVRFLRNDSGLDIYAAEDLEESTIQYEAKAFDFRGITREDLEWGVRKRKLQRMKRKPNVAHSVRHRGVTYIFTKVDDGQNQHATSSPCIIPIEYIGDGITIVHKKEPSSEQASARPSLDAIGRRYTLEFNKVRNGDSFYIIHAREMSAIPVLGYEPPTFECIPMNQHCFSSTSCVFMLSGDIS